MDKELINKFVENYKPDGNLVKPDDKLLEFGKNMLPKEIIYLWENYGFGDYGNGIIKVIDPRDYMNSLYTWLGEQDFNKIPIMVSAFGDIFYYRKLNDNENDVALLDIHYRKIEVCSFSYQEFFDKYIVDNNTKEKVLRKKLYDESVKELGSLKHNEIFFFVPAIVIGGAEDIKYIKKGAANVHHQVLLQINNGG